MCNPMAVAMVVNVGQHAMGEAAKRGNRRHATEALKIGRMGEAQRQTEEMTAAELERDKIRRKSRIAQGSISASGAARGTSGSSSIGQLMNEFGAREGEYQSAISAKRDQQALAGNIRDAGRISQWQGRMMQNKSSGLMGYALAAGQGYMQGKMLEGAFPDVGGLGGAESMTNVPGMGTFPTGTMGFSDKFLLDSGAKVYPDGMFP